METTIAVLRDYGRIVYIIYRKHHYGRVLSAKS